MPIINQTNSTDSTDRAKGYHRAKRFLAVGSLVISMGVLFLLADSGVAAAVGRWAEGVSDLYLLRVAAGVTVFAGILYVVFLPLHWLESFYLEHKYNLSRQSFGSWTGEELKRAALMFVIFEILVCGAYVCLHAWPRLWWLAAATLWLLVSLVLTRIMPNVIIPLFYRYSRIEDAMLRERILALFKQCGVGIQDVYVVDFSRKTSKANAFICGVGRGRRVVLSDTLVEKFSHEEILTVIAHELSHYVHRDILTLTAGQSALTLAAFYAMHAGLHRLLPFFGLERLDAVASFPLVALAFVLFSFLTGPIFNGLSRRLEVRADRFAISLTKTRQAFISMMGKLKEMNLEDPAPPGWEVFWFYDHPPVDRRIRMARDMDTV